MRKTRNFFSLIAIAAFATTAICLTGCKSETRQMPASNEPAPKNSFQGQVQANSKMPQAAKDALLHKGSGK